MGRCRADGPRYAELDTEQHDRAALGLAGARRRVSADQRRARTWRECGDPYTGLDAEQRSVLQEATKLGFPIRGWWQDATLEGGAFGAVLGGVRSLDSSYVDDFWTKSGYEGSDPSVAAARIQHDTTVVSVTGTPPRAIELADVPAGDFIGADLLVSSGAAADSTIPIAKVVGNVVTIGSGADSAVTGAIHPGDGVRLDNSWAIALQYYQRHQVPTPDQYGWNQYRGSDGTPLFP